MTDEIQRALDALYVEIDAGVQRGSEILAEELKAAASQGAEVYKAEFTWLDTPTWEALYKPALMARMLHHLAQNVEQASKDWERVFFQSIRRSYEEGQ